MDEVCWVTNTYYVPSGEVLQKKDVTEYSRINYYQWVPLLLLVQALMFYLPHLIWQGMLLRSGLDLSSIVSTGAQVHAAENKEEREKKLKFMAYQLENYLTHYQQIENGCLAKFSAKVCQALNRLLCGKRTGSFIVLLYVFTKMLYLANAIGQFFILEKFLSSDIHAYGWKVFTSIIAGGDWPEAEVFPKSTMCIFDLHAFGGQVHTNVVQCVLPINFFHDKLYILVWFWLVIVAVFNGLSLIFWIMKFLFRVDRVRFVNHHLRALGKVGNKDKSGMRFVSDFLKQDGVFVLRLVNLNVSGLVSAQMTGELWEIFKQDDHPHRSHKLRNNIHDEGESV